MLEYIRIYVIMYLRKENEPIKPGGYAMKKTTAKKTIKKTAAAKTAQPTKASVSDMITNIIIAKLEAGVIPWRKPWIGGNKNTNNQPRNLVTKKTYRGINLFLLANTGFESPYFLTYKQCSDKGGQVKTGSKGFPCVFWSMVDVTDDLTGTDKKIPFLRYYTVFNLEQTTLEAPATIAGEITEEEETPSFSPIEAAEAIVAGMPYRPEIRHGQQRAFYSPSLDYVNMPKPETFVTDAEYYSTLFHELTHATGHQARVNRKGITESSYFGSHEYSKEELVAEMGAVFLCAASGIEEITLDNSAAYIQSWIRALKSQDNKGLIVAAAGQAQKAYDYILNINPAAEKAEGEEMKLAA